MIVCMFPSKQKTRQYKAGCWSCVVKGEEVMAICACELEVPLVGPSSRPAVSPVLVPLCRLRES